MRRSLRSVYLSEDAKLAQHYGDVLDMLVTNPHYADEAKNDLLDKVQPAARQRAEDIVAAMKKYASAPRGQGRDKMASDIVSALEQLPVREGKSRRFGRLDEARHSFSLGFVGDRSGYDGPTLTGIGSVSDQRWPTVNEASDDDASKAGPGDAVIQTAADAFSHVVSVLETLMGEVPMGGHAGETLRVAVRKLQRLAAETDDALRS